MSEETKAQLPPVLTQIPKPLALIPVTIKEAALDSPTFRATALHFSEQIELLERWLDNYVKAAAKLTSEASTIENLVNTFLSGVAPPNQVSEAVLDHDYTLLALRRYSEGAREYWQQTLRGIKRLEIAVCKPVRAFLTNDLVPLKEARRNLDSAQRSFDSLVGRYAGQSKTKEASSLREDAFQLHESRKQYLKASMDYCVLAPQVRASLDELLVKICSEQWRDMRNAREGGFQFAKWSSEMDRIRGWSKEMENGEKAFKRELQMARKQIEESAELAFRPSRELDDYAVSTVPFLGSGPSKTGKPATAERKEKQGWLFQRTVSGKPTRTIWVRRWFYVKTGIFGWLVQGARSGAVEESEKIGVLLCAVRAAFQEERRFCFEVKTKDATIMLQAETQTELTEWIAAFEVAKRKALDDPASTDQAAAAAAPVADPAFAISPPIAPELAAKVGEGQASHGADDIGADRAGSLAVPDLGLGGLASRQSFDVSARRANEPESSRDQYTRIIQKLDLHRKGQTATPQLSSQGQAPPTGGIASLITASHAIVPVGPVQAPAVDAKAVISTLPATSTLAPSTLAYPPAPTNLSKTVVVISGERGLTVGQSDGGMPGGLLANLWGTSNWGYWSRVERGELSSPPRTGTNALPTMPSKLTGAEDNDAPRTPSRSPSGPYQGGSSGHRKAASDVALSDVSKLPQTASAAEDFPSNYPVQLRAQDAQFRLLFPYVPRGDRLVLVFRATFNPNDQQEFPGRVYVTTEEIYFYSHHLGLILITSVRLSTISEVTAAPGKDCDFLFLHLREGTRQDGATRITIKTFLEPLRLLQRRLNYLVRRCNSDNAEWLHLEGTVKALTDLETEPEVKSRSVDSWEDVDIATPTDGLQLARPGEKDVKASLRIDGALYRDQEARSPDRTATKFKLPAQPVNYAPQGMSSSTLEREYNVSAKSLFHVLCGDKSAVFQLLYFGLGAERVIQQPWKQTELGHYQRDIQYQVGSDSLVRSISDQQCVDVYNDHLCYVVSDRKTPWHLPGHRSFNLLSKIVITHVSKARCKFAVFTRVEWAKPVLVGQRLIEARAEQDMRMMSLSLADLIEDQVARVRSSSAASSSSTRKAMAVFGPVGRATVATSVSASDVAQPTLASGFSQFRKRRLQSTSLSKLAYDSFSFVGAEVASAVLGGIAQILQSCFKVLTAHGLLVAMLLTSTVFNFYYAQDGGRTWWREKNALRYLKELGVAERSTNTARAVWLKDLDNYVGNISVLDQSSPGTADWSTGLHGSNLCLGKFRSQLTGADGGHGSEKRSRDPHAEPRPGEQETGLFDRLQHVRTQLGGYRYDLLVALRLVTRVEKEVVQAELETWIGQEARRCRMAGIMFDDGEGSPGQSHNGPDEQSRQQLKQGWARYCGDCYNAAEPLGGIGDERIA